MKSTLFASLVIVTFAVGCGASNDDNSGAEESDVTAGTFTSAYTELGPLQERCQLDEEHAESGFSRWHCGTMGDQRLYVESFDSRQNVAIRTLDGALHDLQVQQRTTSGFGHLGAKAEWRGYFASAGEVNPRAVIFRYIETNAQSGEDDREWLLVARLRTDHACVVAVVDANQAGANEAARAAADDAETARCLGVQPTDH